MTADVFFVSGNPYAILESVLIYFVMIFHWEMCEQNLSLLKSLLFKWISSVKSPWHFHTKPSTKPLGPKHMYQKLLSGSLFWEIGRENIILCCVLYVSSFDYWLPWVQIDKTLALSVRLLLLRFIPVLKKLPPSLAILCLLKCSQAS